MYTMKLKPFDALSRERCLGYFKLTACGRQQGGRGLAHVDAHGQGGSKTLHSKI